MTQLKSLAHPEWPYTGTPNEWRGFIKNKRRVLIPAGYRVADPLKALSELNKPDGVIEIVRDRTVYQQQNFGPELK